MGAADCKTVVPEEGHLVKNAITRGVGRNSSKGGRFECFYFQKGYFWTDLFPNTLYRKCIKIALKKGDRPTPSPPLLSYAPDNMSG